MQLIHITHTSVNPVSPGLFDIRGNKNVLCLGSLRAHGQYCIIIISLTLHHNYTAHTLYINMHIINQLIINHALIMI